MLGARTPVSSWLRIGASLLLVAVSLALAVVLPADRADAAVIRPFTEVFSTQTNGSIQVTGNSVLSCGTATGCAQALSGATASSNNNFTMVPLDTDADPSTTRSSSANLAIPPGARVLYAGLFWGGARTAGTSGVAASGTVGNIRFRVPGSASYQTVAAQQVDNQTTSGTLDYSAYSNVTDLVRGAGPGTYWGADIVAATGVDRYAGWSLVVAVEDPAAPLRDLTVFSGYATVVSNETVDTTISGFLAPPTGAVGARFGGVTYEGDAGITGDYFQVGTSRLADAQSPSANFFGSRITNGGANLTNRTPASLNNLGIDAKVVDAPGTIPNGATSANLRFASTGDFYYPAALTTQIDLYAPTIQGSKSVTNLSGNTPAKVGDVLEYSVTFSNTGEDAATNAVVTDPIPAGTSFVPGSLRVTAGANQGAKTDAAGDDQGEFVAASRTVRLRVGTGATATVGGRLAPSATTTAAFRVRVDTAGAGTTLRNSAALAYRAETIGRDYTYTTAEVATPVAAEADVSLTKSAAPEPVLAGNQVTYALTARNAGPNAAAGVQVVDTLPEGVVLVSSNPSTGTCSFSSPTLTCGLGALASGATATVSVVVRVPPGSAATALTNVARISAATSDPNPGNNSASATTTVLRQADLGLTKSASPTDPVPGTAVTYTLVATNDGASRAADVTITDTLPATLAVRSATTDRGTCEVTGSQVSCTAAGLDPGESATVTVVADVPSGATSVPLTNNARVGSTTPDPDSSNNAATVTVTPQAPRADLVVTKEAVTSPVVAGRGVQYVVTVRNDGPSDAAAVTLDDQAPASLSGVAATPTAGSCTVSAAGRVQCDLGTLAAGRSVEVAVNAQLDAGATGTLVNSATATSPTADPAPGNNTGTSSVPVTTSADLSVTKSATPVPVLAGNVATYSVVVTNDGPSIARSVTVVDPVPAPLTYVGSSTTQGTCATSGTPTTVTCAVGDIPVGGSVTVTVRAGTPQDGSGQGVTNTASASSPTPDPVAGNNSAAFTLPTAAQADVELTKTVTPSPVVAGQTVTYRIVARNTGPSAANGVTVTDTIGARVTGVVATSPTTGASCAATSGNNVSCTVATLASGAELVVEVTGTVAPGAAAGALTNDARVTSATPTDPSLDNNTASATTEVVRSADLSVTKSGTSTLAAGREGEWTLLVSNDGPSTATDVRLTDSLPTGVTFAGATGATCTVDGGVVTCPLGDLAPGASTTVTVRGTVDSGVVAGTELVDTGSVSSTTSDPAPANNTDDHTTTVTEVTDVRVAKSAQSDSFVPGAEGVYLVDVTTDGPSDARDVVVTDTLDASLDVLEATFDGGTCTVVGQLVTCRRDLLPAGATAQARIRVSVDPDRSTPVTNVAEVTSSTDTGTGGNNRSETTTPVTPSADLAIVKTASATEVAAGEGVTYTLTVVNNGPSLAADTVVADVLPAGIVPAAATASAGSCTISGQVVACDLGDVEPGAPVTIVVVGGTGPGAAAGARANQAEVSSATADPVPANNTSQVTVDVVTEADVQVTKTANGDSLVPGGAVSWSIVVNNAGPSTARGIVVTDTVPAAVTVTSAFHGTATPCTVSGQQVTCDLGDRTPGQRVVTIVGTLASSYAGATLANTVQVSATTPDPVPGNNTATATSPITRITDLEIIKTIDDPTPVAGQRITYTLSTYNNGPSDALDVDFIDQLPSGLTDVVVRRPTLEGQPATAECELRQPVNAGTVDNPAAATVFCSGPVFRSGLPARVIGYVDATIAPGFTGALTNSARISSETIDRDAENNEDSVTTQVGTSADLSVTKTVAPERPVPGADVTWTVTVANAGPSVARQVLLTDDVADAVTGLTATAAGRPGACTVAAGNAVTCDLGDLAASGTGSQAVVTLSGRLPADYTGALDNTATVTSPTDDPVPGNNSDTAESTVLAQADVSITKAVAPNPPVPGQDVTWTVTVANAGPSVARDVVVADDVDDAITGLTATTGATPNPCTVAAGNVVTCELGAVAPGSVVVTLTGGVPAGFTGSLGNTATVASPTDTTPGNNSASVSTGTAPSADVSVTKSLAPAAPVPGEEVAYTVVVTNNGPSVARGVVVRDDVADALTGLTATTGAPSNPCTVVAGNEVTCELGDLPATGPGATVTITIRGDLPAGFTGDLDNTAAVTALTPDGDPANNTDTANGTAAPTADVSVTKSLTPAAPVPGEDVTWTVVVANNGPSVARDVVLTDDVPVAVTGVTASSQVPDACTVSGNEVSCDLGDLPPSSTTVTLTGRLDADFTGTLANTVTVASATPDADTDNNTATATGTAAARADVGITKTVSPANPVPGAEVTWTVLVTNTGPSVARDVVVRDDVDNRITGLTAGTGSSPNPCTITAGNDVTCDLGDLLPSTSPVVITLTGQVPAGFTGPLSNTATVASPTDDTPGNNSSTADPTTAPGADLEIVKTVSPATPVPGRDITWTVTVTNRGPSVARDVVVTDDVVAELTGVTASSPCSVGTGNRVSCDLGDLDVGGAASTITVTITGRVPAAFTGDLDNTAEVSSATPDGDLSNNSDTAQATVAPEADVSVTKQVAPASPVPGRDVTWTVVATNAGPSVARGVVLTDDVPDQLTGVTATTGAPATCSVAAGNEVTCDLGVLAPATGVTVTITGRVPAGFTGALANTAVVDADTPDPVPGNNSATASSGTAPSADVSVTKTATPADPVPGRDTTWTVVVANAGPSVARTVVLTDDVPDELTGVSATTGTTTCTVDPGNEVTCQLGDLAPGEDVTVSITGGVPAGFTGELENTAVVEADTPDPVPANNTATATGDADARADVSVTKTATPADPVPGQDTTWTVVVANAGPSLARAVVLTDDVPDELTDVTATTSATATCEVDPGNEVTCGLGDLAPGDDVTVTITARLPSDYTGDLANTAVVDAGTADPDPDNNSSTARGTARPRADVSITKTLDGGPPVPGRTVTWTVTVANAGPSTARDVVVTDPVPDAVTGVTAGAPCTVAAGLVTCELGDVPSGSTETLTVSGRLDEAFTGRLRNTATVASPTDTTPGDNTATAAADSAPSADVSITKTVSPATPVAGEQLTFTLVVRNDGPSAARDVVVSDRLDEVLGEAAATATDGGTCRIEGPEVTCTLPTLGTGRSATVTVTATVDPAHTGAVSNTASVTAATPDPDGTDNSATVTATVGTGTGLTIEKSASSRTVDAGERVTYTITVGNRGPSAAPDVRVVDELDEDLTVVSARITAGEGEVTTTARRLTAVFPALRPRTEGVVRLVARIDADASGRVPNTAVATTSATGGGTVEVQDQAVVEVLADEGGGGDDGDTGGSDGGDGGDEVADDTGGGGLLPDTGLPAGVVPLTALSLLLLALGLWLVRRSRVDGGRGPSSRG
ncbi:hypothetical protein [Nocardioides renjunii]|uniref:hypothetical protein n=1 Tax=Nocardioides renjunii TaxID=3095075 RepID=UPI002AFE6EF2|nr:hypothetical protein [Nocardioides sp. S-34]WQQ20441.1 hypothetical protein SHK17_11025 [Nocardioides sp. S-34]